MLWVALLMHVLCALAAGACNKHYVIVGAGATGAPAAYKLATSGCRVTLVEKGPDDDWVGNGTNGLPLDVYHPEYSYVLAMKYAPNDIQTVVWSEPVWDRTAAGSFPRDWSKHQHADNSSPSSEFTHTTNLVGGNTMHNLLFWIRGALGQFDKFGTGWDRAKVLSAFETLEAMYGAKGPDGDLLNSKKSGMTSSLDDTVMALFKAHGFDEIRSRDLGETSGKAIGWTEWTIGSNGRRLSSGKIFIDPIRKLSGFALLTNASVSRVRFAGKRAIGITYLDRTASVMKDLDADEVILSAGGLFTPHLLLSSGVGPAADLKRLGIPVVADLPVGKTYHSRAKITIFYCFKGDIYRPNASIEFAAYPSLGKDTPSSFMSTQPNMWAMVKSPMAEGPYADLAIWLDTNNGFSLAPAKCNAGEHPILFLVANTLPRSRGEVSINSEGDLTYQPNFLKEAHDAKVISYGIDLIRDSLSEDKRFRELMPTAATQREYIYKTAGTWWQDSATAPIGAVVDSNLRVKGVSGLRVADTSVHPSMSNTPPSAMCHVTGFLGADIMLEEDAPFNSGEL